MVQVTLEVEPVVMVIATIDPEMFPLIPVR